MFRGLAKHFRPGILLRACLSFESCLKIKATNVAFMELLS